MAQDPTNPSDIQKQATDDLARALTPSLETELRRARYQDQTAGQNAPIEQATPTTGAPLTEPGNRFTTTAPDETPATSGQAPGPATSNQPPLPSAPSRENALNQERNKDKTAEAKDQAETDKASTDAAGQNTKDAGDKDKPEENKDGTVSDDMTKLAGKQTTAGALTGMWGAVWLDWTLLTLLGLNAYFVGTWFTDKIAGFGEDHLFGRMLGKELGKWFEIILLFMIDAVIIGIIFGIGYIGYSLYNCTTWTNGPQIWAASVLPGGNTWYEEVAEQCF